MYEYRVGLGSIAGPDMLARPRHMPLFLCSHSIGGRKTTVTLKPQAEQQPFGAT
jgi:hypothetical protein